MVTYTFSDVLKASVIDITFGVDTATPTFTEPKGNKTSFDYECSYDEQEVPTLCKVTPALESSGELVLKVDNMNETTAFSFSLTVAMPVPPKAPTVTAKLDDDTVLVNGGTVQPQQMVTYTFSDVLKASVIDITFGVDTATPTFTEPKGNKTSFDYECSYDEQEVPTLCKVTPALESSGSLYSRLTT
eukprot:gnl/Chilomastix_caulleri/1253.p1 GENE.gnl/Chilomastix_caulleri/1253~~gnl/Chilomastix_caulleri/1253.p1  ORF type:complete len:187 (-),score=81.52 gnl/Chilomastix_caulleri/1253:115-675(-)